MKDLLLNPDGSINWKFILLIILGSVVTGLVYIMADLYYYGYREFTMPRQRMGMLLAGELSFFCVLSIWAWFGFKNPFVGNRWANCILVGLLAGIVSEVVRVPLYAIALERNFSAPVEIQEILPSVLCVFDWLLIIILCEAFGSKFKNKVLLYFVMASITSVVFVPLFALANSMVTLSWSMVIPSLIHVTLMGVITLIILRIFGVKFFHPETPEMQIRRFIIAKMKTGSQKPEIWNEVVSANPDFPRRKMAKIFTTVSQDSDDWKEFRFSQFYLITYTLLSCLPLIPRLTQSPHFSSGDWWGELNLFIIFLLFVKLYFVYAYLSHHAWVYRLTISFAVVVGLLSFLMSLVLGGWVHAVSGIFHLIAAAVAHHIATTVYPNYRLFYKPSPQYIEKL